MFSVGSTVSASAIDPDVERAPPPAATLVYFPQNDISSSEFVADDKWPTHTPNLTRKYGGIARPSNIQLADLKVLNLTEERDVPIEQFVPIANDGYEFLPSIGDTRPSSRRNSSLKVRPAAGALKNQLLSNGHKAPDDETFMKHYRELICENEDGWRKIQNRKPLPGHITPNIVHTKRFWTQLELIATYWDTSLDNYYDLGDQPPPEAKAAKPSKSGLRRFSLAMHTKEPAAEPRKGGIRYKGRRSSTGAKMPEAFRVDLIRHFINPIVMLFGCVMLIPKKVPQMELGALRLPVTQNSVIWRNSQDKYSLKEGITEGPVLGLQCRGEVNFVKEHHTAVLDIAREFAGLLLLAEERAREGKIPRLHGVGEWYTSKPRWGGGPGGEFGEAEGNTDHPAPKNGVRRLSLGHHSTPEAKKTEEDIWKELKPTPSLWDPRHTYLAVGKDRAEPFDHVFMISSIYHHVAILKLTVHPLYIDWLLSDQRATNIPPDIAWFKPLVERTRWYDLLIPADRGEVFRGIWGVMAYQMRSGHSLHLDPSQRQKSDSHQHHFSLKKRHPHLDESDHDSRASSVAF